MRVPGAQHHRALDHVLELAHVARPVVVHQQVERFRRELEFGTRVLLAVLLEEVLHQQRDVVLALAQRRQLDRDDVQPVEQVLAEASVFHLAASDRRWWRR